MSGSQISILDNCADGDIVSEMGDLVEPGRTQRWLCSFWEAGTLRQVGWESVAESWISS